MPQSKHEFFQKVKRGAVEYLDMFGQTPSFRVMEKNKFNSLLGLLTTLMIGGITIIYLTTEVISMLNKSEPAVVSTEIQVFDTSSFALENDNFTLAISVTNHAGNSLIGNGYYYNITISHCIRTRTIGENGALSIALDCKLLPIEPCNITHFTTDVQNEYFKTMRFGAMQCINREYLKTHPPALQGQLNSLIYQYVEIQLKQCINSTTVQACAPQEEIEQKLNNGHYVVYMSDFLMQLGDPYSPYKEIINSDFSGISPSTSKVIQSYFSIVETTSDDGLLFQSLTTATNLKLKEQKEASDFYNKEYLVDHYIALDYRSQQYSRTYIKVQAILSKIGGIWQIFIILVAHIINPFINYKMNIEIANQIYRFQCVKSGKGLAIGTQFSHPKSDGQLPKDFRSTLRIMSGCNQLQRRLFDKAKKKIMENLDMIQIIQKLQEIELLKQVLLTKEQLYLFSVLPKPLIEDKDDDQQLDIFQIASSNNNVIPQNQPDFIQQAEQYKKIINNSQRTLVDERLISLIDKQTLDQIQRKISQINNVCLSPHSEFKDYEINEPMAQYPK